MIRRNKRERAKKQYKPIRTFVIRGGSLVKVNTREGFCGLYPGDVVQFTNPVQKSFTSMYNLPKPDETERYTALFLGCGINKFELMGIFIPLKDPEENMKTEKYMKRRAMYKKYNGIPVAAFGISFLHFVKYDAIISNSRRRFLGKDIHEMTIIDRYGLGEIHKMTQKSIPEMFTRILGDNP